MITKAVNNSNKKIDEYDKDLEKCVKKMRNFFKSSKFFDSHTRKKIERKSGIPFQELMLWCCNKCHEMPKEITYIGNIEYVKFILFSVYRNKETLEKLWKKTSHAMDKSYRIRMLDNSKQFKQYLWEMYLKNYFIKKGNILKQNSNNIGPDICLKDNLENIYIECIAPDVGNNNFKVPKIKNNSCGTIPIEKLKQRLKYALNTKITKYKEYIRDNKVLKKDQLLIAVNTSCLSNYNSLMDYTDPLIVEVCKEINIFENNSFINGIIYNHKSIFEYNSKFKVIFINADYSVKEDEIQI